MKTSPEHLQHKITIAIDGYSSCGKSTLAKSLAHKLDYIYIDSGSMYRAVTFAILQNKIDYNENLVEPFLDTLHITFSYNSENKKCTLLLNDVEIEEEIRRPQVSELVSKISALKPVREKLVAIQKVMGNDSGVVMDGRDIGTRVFPDAELKLFMTADPKVRAQRRWLELQEKEIKVSFEEVFENLRKRDYDDTHRKESPLTKASDAFLLDTTHLTPDEMLEISYNLAMKKIAEKAGDFS